MSEGRPDAGPDTQAGPEAAVVPLVWIPRPLEDAEPLADALAATGIRSLIAPVMTVAYRREDVPLTGVAAVLFTSANGVRAFARNSDRRDIAVYAVGTNTADEARTTGFENVRAAGGDVDMLADLIAAERDPADGALLHVAASERAGDLAGLLRQRGFSVDRRVLYDAVAVEALPPAVAEALDDGAVDAVALFSPRTSRIVCDLLVRAQRQDAAPGLTALCLSANVAEAAKALEWREIVVAERPDRASLLQAVRLALQTGGQDAADTPAAAKEPAAGEPVAADAPLPGETMMDTNDDNSGDKSGQTPVGSMPDAETVIDRFGGIRPMAQKLGVTPSTIQGWKARNHIPENRWDEVRSVAEKEGVSLDAAGAAAAELPQPEQIQPAAGEPEASPVENKTEKEEDVESPVLGATKEQEDTLPPPPPPAAAAARRPSGTAWLALIIALTSAAGLATQSYWRPSVEGSLNAHLSRFFGPPPSQTPAPPDPALAQSVETLLGRINALENRPAPEAPAAAAPVDVEAALAPLADRLAALEDALASVPSVSPETVDLGPLNAAVDALRTRVNAMDTRADESLDAFRAELSTFADQFDAIRAGIQTVTDRIAAVERRLAQIESAYGGPSGSEAALVLTVGQLDSLMAASEPFGGTLQDIAALAPEDEAVQQAVAALTPLRDAVIPSRAELIDAFADIAPAVDRAERVAGAEGWVDETLAELRGLVSIRRTDATETAPAVSRAEAAIAQGDLAGAVAAVEPLAGQDPVIADWVAKAKQRVTAVDSLKALRAAALARLRMAATGG